MTPDLFPVNLPYPVPLASVQALSPIALAYVGDAVYELYVRSQYIFPPSRIRDYHQRVVACVRAEAQAAFIQDLLPHLNEAEVRIFKQGRNAATGHPKRLRLDVYQQATGLETLVGYLYLTDRDRLQEIFQSLPLDPSASAESL